MPNNSYGGSSAGAADRIQMEKASRLQNVWRLSTATDPISMFLKILGVTVISQSATLLVLATNFWTPVCLAVGFVGVVALGLMASHYGRSPELGAFVSAVLIGVLFALIGVIF